MGLAVSRRVGGAVVRNRARRLLRESFRRADSPQGPGLDLVVVARPGLVGCGLAEVERELRERLRQLRRPARSGGAGAAAPR
jgi:ribonuclease P protein component